MRIKPFKGHPIWEKAVVSKRLDQRSYIVQTPTQNLRRNRVHLRRFIKPMDNAGTASTQNEKQATTLLPHTKPDMEEL